MNTSHIQVKDSNASPWKRPSDWIDISSVGNNEINLLVNDSTALAFTVTTASGTFSVDWGDGVIETGLASGVIQTHQHTSNGTPCSLGYNTWKVRIYGASSNIIGYANSRHTFITKTQVAPILDMVFGTNYLTSLGIYSAANPGISLRTLKSCTLPQFLSTIALNLLFSGAANLEQINLPSSFGAATTTTSMFNTCKSLAYIKMPSSWGNVTSANLMFNYCTDLTEIVLPASWESVTNATSMFANCTTLYNPVLPETWGSSFVSANLMFNSCTAVKTVCLPSAWGTSMTDLSSMFNSCANLDYIVLPSSWNNITNLSNMFYNTNLKKITLPDSWGSVTNVISLFQNCVCLIDVTLPSSLGNITDAINMFTWCYQIMAINNLGFVGNSSVVVDLSYFINECVGLTQAYSTNSLIKKIILSGASGYPMKITSIRLTNPASTYTGSSPHIDVSYTSLNAAALNLLFGDLPTLAAKTINITGCPGAATCTRSIATGKGWTVTG